MKQWEEQTEEDGSSLSARLLAVAEDGRTTAAGAQFGRTHGGAMKQSVPS